MKIAQVTATFPPYWGGTGNVCYYNSRELARRGHQVHVYTASLPGAPDEERLEGVHIHRLRPLIRFGNAPLLPKLINLQGFDLIHLHHPFIFGAEIIRLASALHRTPYVLTHHNDLTGDGNRRWLFHMYSLVSIPWIFTGARRLIPVSQDYAQHGQLARLFNQHQAMVVELPNGVDPDVFKPLSGGQETKISLGIPREVPLVLFVAVLDRAHHFKGLNILLQALAQPKVRETHLLVLGDGELRPQYEALAVKLNIDQRVHFGGKIANRDLPVYLSAGDFLMLPSSPPESFGLVLIESLACGTPVIASNIPGVRTVVTDGLDGLLAKPGDIPDLAEKIAHMLALPEAQRRAMGAAGRRKVERQYTWELAADRLEAIYQGVLYQGGDL